MDVASGEVLKQIDFGAVAKSVGFSPDGSKIVIGGRKKEVEVCYWKIYTRFQICWANFDVIIRSETSLPARSWKFIRVIPTGCTRSLSALVAARSFPGAGTTPWGYVGNVLGVIWGKTHHGSFTPQVWDVASGEVLKKIDCKSNALSVQFSPDGSKLAIGLGYGQNYGQVWVSCFVFCSLDDHIERDLCTF